MAKILILGAGAMGSAFSVPSLERQHEVIIAGTHLEDAFIDEIKNNNNFHPSLKIHLSEKTNITKHMNLSEEFKKKPDLIVVGVNSKGINWVVDQLSVVLNDSTLSPILMLTKGLSIYENKYELLVDKLERLLISKGYKNINISAVGGPCLAIGLANKVHTSVIFANKNLSTVEWLKDILTTDYYHPSISNDMIGVEVCAAIKNIFSMGIGSTKDLNAAAGLIQQSIDEMIIFTEKLEGKKETVIGLAGIGDLYVSADGGRNSKMGQYIGQGMTFKEAKKIKMPNDTIEGADLALEIGTKVKSDFDNKTLPLMTSMINTICDEVPLKIDWKNFK